MGELNALIIMPDFYEYPHYIKHSVESVGFHVDLIYEQPDRMEYLIKRNIGRYIGQDKVFHSFNNRLFNKISSFENKYDFFLVIRGNILSPVTISRIRQNYLTEDAISVYYSWDSFKNLVHKGKLGEFFDKRYSFDSEDVKENPNYELLPLFYTKTFDFSQDASSNDSYEYDLCCLGAFTLERYELVKQIIERNPQLKICVRLYLPRNLYRTKFLSDKRFRKLDFSMVTFDSLSQEEVVSLYKRTKGVLDLTNSAQTGLSMRTIESIGMRKKMVTNNMFIREYPFYSDENIAVINKGGSFSIDKAWIEQDASYDEEIRKKLSIDNWAEKLLSR